MRWLSLVKILTFIILTSCDSKAPEKPLQIGTWKAVNESSGADIDILDSAQFNMLLRSSDGTVDSIRWWYKLEGKRFDIYTHAFLASENEVLTLTEDSFVYARPNDLDTFRYSRMQ